ncbi:MAG: M23 family metallopeptidase [Lachnospiraceae bacterium]|nr:M23 family metallopeptidase [Lachnospiraceae bacterium]MDE7184278.1 M23 family metallopeptidase [Lachnospiraceae bacterium]
MKQQKHQRKETFSLIFASNIGNDTRQFYLSVATLRLIIVLMALICVTFVWTIFRSGAHYQSETELRKKLASSEQTVKRLEKEKNALSAQNAALEEENELFRQAETLRAELVEETASKTVEEEAPRDTSVPSQYPCTAGGILKEHYTEEHPYISFSAQPEDQIIAAGDGTVMSVGADDTYPIIIEVDHGNGYRSRYMCLQEAEVSVETGQQVQVRDTLVTVNGGAAQLDYQVLYEEQAIDPLQILEAKG